jgi:hypothetical protein
MTKLKRFREPEGFSKSGREGSSLLFVGKLIPSDMSSKTDKYLIILYIHLWNEFCTVST